VIAAGTGGVASFYDLPSNDTFSLRSDTVLFEGGGFRIETQNFQTANVYSVSGGNDTAVVYGENDSHIIIADTIVDRIDTASHYRIWNVQTITAVNVDETNNAVTFLNTVPRNEYNVALGCISASNVQQTISWQAVGFDTMAVHDLADVSCNFTVYLEEGSRMEWQNDLFVMTDGTRQVAMPPASTFTYRPLSPAEAGQRMLQTPLAAVDSLFSQVTELFESDDRMISDGFTADDTAELPLSKNIDDQLLRFMVWENQRKNKTTIDGLFGDDHFDDEINLLRLFAKRVATLQSQ